LPGPRPGYEVAARKPWIKWWRRLAAGIANVCYIANPEVIVLGGGIMAQAKYIGPRLDAELKKALLPVIYKGTRGVFAKLGNDAGMVGAVYNFLHCHGSGK
jgi:predicted NBD/HSP70 family sugar kinase